MTCLRQVDQEILKDLIQEGVTDKDIMEEAQVVGNLKGDINATIAALAELLKQNPPSLQQQQLHSARVSESTPTTSQNVRVKLPKLKVKRFNGKIEEWQEFWDCYECSISLWSSWRSSENSHFRPCPYDCELSSRYRLVKGPLWKGNCD